MTSVSNRITFERDLCDLEGVGTLSTVMRRIVELADDPDQGPRELADVICTDQVLTARTLKLVNSSFYGLSRRITTVSAATAMLGFRTVRALALATSTVDLLNLDSKAAGLDRVLFWRYALAMAATARSVAAELREKVPDEAFVAGLLADAGCLVLAARFPDRYARALDARLRLRVPLSFAEKEALGVTHADVIGWLAERWNLPREMAVAMERHHEDTNGTSRMADIVVVAEALVRISGISPDNMIDPVSPGAVERLGLDIRRLARLANGIDAELQRAVAFFDACGPGWQPLSRNLPQIQERPQRQAVLWVVDRNPAFRIASLSIELAGFAREALDPPTIPSGRRAILVLAAPGGMDRDYIGRLKSAGHRILVLGTSVAGLGSVDLPATRPSLFESLERLVHEVPTNP